MKRLPEREFEVMKIVWESNPPVTTGITMEQIGSEKGWKIQTVVTLMKRLTERGFLRSEKQGQERLYYPMQIWILYLNGWKKRGMHFTFHNKKLPLPL